MESKESSVLFSLKELMSLEAQRVADEEQRRSHAAAMAEQQRRDAHDARVAAEEASARAEAWRERQETAHLQAIREAELERARREADAARAPQQQQHLLAALRHDDGHKKRLRSAPFVLGALLLASLGLCAATLVHEADQNRAARARERQVFLEQQQAYDEVQKLLRSQTEQVESLRQRALEISRTAPVQNLPTPASTAPSPHASGPRALPPKPKPAPEPCADRWDPLCGRLP